MRIISMLSEELGIREEQAEAVIRLMEEGATIPFIARYRKDQTGGLDDEKLRVFEERLKYLNALEERKETVLASIREQGKLTDSLRKAIEEVKTAVKLEDLYRPYKPKRRTRAMIAREKGMSGLAGYILSSDARDAAGEARKYVNPEKGVETPEAALSLARDIIAGDLSDDPKIREWIRGAVMRDGVIVSSGSAGEPTPYEMYYDYREAVSKIPGHRVLALNRGEKEKVLSVKVEMPEEKILRHLEKSLKADRNPKVEEQRKLAAADAFHRLIQPSVEKEVRNALTEKAREGAIGVFRENLKQLLMQPPVAGHGVLGWDPGFRNGCKLAAVDATGKVLDTAVVRPTEPYNRVREAEQLLSRWVRQYHLDLIAVGNGTASRESEKIVADFIRKSGLPVQYVIVNEAGASVYSASKLASEEYPELDVEGRGAASLAKRLQDPLAELVKIDPKSIGVGQYQHDMDQKKLGEALNGVVEDCVNRVGVDLNTASVSLLEYVSGISKNVAKNIVKYRDENGAFRCRRDLLKVPKLGPKAFQQCAGFLRIRNGEEPLDMTGVHPESYGAARILLRDLGYREEDVREGRTTDIVRRVSRGASSAAGLSRKDPALEKLSRDTGAGLYTLRDILAELEKPGRDPRDEIEKPILRSDVLSLEDLKPGMRLKGTVRNIVDFGAFVDIGVHQDGLVHISQLADRYVKHPLDVVKVGDIVEVRVLSVDFGRKKISLTMRSEKGAGKNC